MMRLILICSLVFLPQLCAAEQTVSQAITTLQKLDVGDSNIAKAVQSAKTLQADAPKDVLAILTAMKEATPIGRNWLASIANSQYYTALESGDKDKLYSELATFLDDQSNDPEARTLVFDWLRDAKPDQMLVKLATMTGDSSPELRFAAIEKAFSEIDQEKPDIAKLEQLLDSARHPDQVRAIIKLLNEHGKSINQPKYFGFLCDWYLIGPFDNRGQKHFDTVYEVEKDLLSGSFNPKKSYEGKEGKTVSWMTHTTDEKEGMVNLANIFTREKGAVVYAYSKVSVPVAITAQIRLTSINGNKAWINGKEVISNEVYHAGTRLDQYIANVELNAGENIVVLKILQNEQTESWAQDYQFHCRITDLTGKAIAYEDLTLQK